jgi:hypothetical protein
MGLKENGGPFSLLELKNGFRRPYRLEYSLIFTLFFFQKMRKIAWNHLVGFAFLMLAVFFCFSEKNEIIPGKK